MKKKLKKTLLLFVCFASALGGLHLLSQPGNETVIVQKDNGSADTVAIAQKESTTDSAIPYRSLMIPATEDSAVHYTLQLGLYVTEKEAAAAAEELKETRCKPLVVKVRDESGMVWYLLSTGEYATVAEVKGEAYLLYMDYAIKSRVIRSVPEKKS